MSSYKTISILILILAAYSCNNNPKKSKKENSIDLLMRHEVKYPISLDFEKAVDDWREVNLSEIADSIEYIKLEGTDKSFIKKIHTFSVTDSFIFIPQYVNVLQFDRKGNFIRVLGKKGRGPKEYLNVFGTAVNNDLQEVYVNSGGTRKIQVYNFEGKHLRSLKYFTCGDFNMAGPNTIISYIENDSGQEQYKLLLTNENRDTINFLTRTDQFKKPKVMYSTIWVLNNILYKNNNKVHFDALYNDTIFCIDTPQKIYAKYVLQKGKYKLPMDKRMETLNNVDKFNKLSKPYLNTSFIESNSNAFVKYQGYNHNNEQKLALYDKKTTEFYTVGNKTERKAGFRNDLSNSGYFIPYQIYNDKIMINCISAMDFLEKYSHAKDNPLVSESFRTIYNNTKDTDNFVLEIVHLKN